MSEKMNMIHVQKNRSIISLKNTNSRMKLMPRRPDKDRETINSQRQDLTINTIKFKEDNGIPAYPPRPPSKPITSVNLLNNIKRSILVQVQDKGDSSKEISSKVLTSPHISQEIKNKYSQIYLETMTQNNSYEHSSLVPTANVSRNTSIIKKREEIMSLLNAHNPIGNSQVHRSTLTSMTNSPTKRSEKKSSLEELSAKIGLLPSDVNKVKPPLPTESNLRRNIDNGKALISKYHSIHLPSENNDEYIKQNGKCNSIKIVKARSKIEKMLNDDYRPVTFSSNALKKNQRKIERKTQIKADKEETENFLTVLALNNNSPI